MYTHPANPQRDFESNQDRAQYIVELDSAARDHAYAWTLDELHLSSVDDAIEMMPDDLARQVEELLEEAARRMAGIA